MSVRALETEHGTQRPHKFIDGLESFFWLIFWSVAAHLDPDSDPTPAAQKTIDQLEQLELDQVVSFKKSIFFECIGSGKRLKRRLLKFENCWVTSTVSSLILSLGKFFAKEESQEQDIITPFSYVVDTVWKALYEEQI